MIEEKTTALLGPKARPFLIAAAIFSALALAFLARLAQADVLKIALIHGACVCVMFMIVACKNYLSKIEILIFCFLGVQFLASAPRPEALNPFVASHYFFSYRYGVSSRSLAATILDFFTGGGFVSATLLWHFITGATALLAFAISSFIAAAMRGVSGEAKIFAVFIIFLWLSSFVAPAFYFTVANFGRVEIFALIALFAVAVVADRPRLKWLVPILALVVLATHLILVFFLMPFIGIVLLYWALKEKPGSVESRRAWILLTVTVALALAAFALYLLFAKGTLVFENPEIFYAHLIERTNAYDEMGAFKNGLHFIMFASLEDHLEGWRMIVELLFPGHQIVLICLPLVALFVTFWIKCFFREREKRMRFFFLVPILALPYNAIAFFLFFDFGRWVTMSLAVQFMLVLFLMWRRNETVLEIALSGARLVRQHVFLAALICILMAFLGPVLDTRASENARNIFSIIRVLTGFITGL